MKIHIPKHDIRESDHVSLKEIPLAYVNCDETKYVPNISIEKDFAKESKEIVRAYTEFDDPDIFLFNSNKEIITDVPLKRLGNRYTYEPTNLVEYTPVNFSCSALVKKNMSFKNDNQFNIRVAVVEEGADLKFASSLITIFGDAYRRGVCPSNIRINNGSMTPQSLISSKFKDNDFVFLKSKDGKNTVSEGKDVEFDVDAILDEHVNLWMSVESFGNMLTDAEAGKNITLADTNLYNTKAYPQSEAYKMFNVMNENPDYPSSEYTYKYLCESVLLLEKKDKGFIIVTPSWLLDNLNKNVNIIYEVMMYVILNGYYRSREEASWITNEPIDYMAYHTSKLNARHKRMNLADMLKNNRYNIGNEYTLLSVDTSVDDVMFMNIAPNKDMFFFKVGAKTDPVKNDNQISYFTTKKTVIHYEQMDVNMIESLIDLEANVIDSVVYLTVHPYQSTLHKINTKSDQTLKLDSNSLTYFICTRESAPEIENIFEAVPEYTYSSEAHGMKVATVKVNIEPSTKTYDIRVLGGGLPTSEPDNYNLLDIGHIYGRPYRIGSTLIIRLPKALERYEDIIRKAIDKHASSGDYPVLIFK